MKTMGQVSDRQAIDRGKQNQTGEAGRRAGEARKRLKAVEQKMIYTEWLMRE